MVVGITVADGIMVADTMVVGITGVAGTVAAGVAARASTLVARIITAAIAAATCAVWFRRRGVRAGGASTAATDFRSIQSRRFRKARSHRAFLLPQTGAPVTARLKFVPNRFNFYALLTFTSKGRKHFLVLFIGEIRSI